MKRPRSLDFDELRSALFAATDGRDACEIINQLSKAAKKGADEAKQVLASYALEGSIGHMKSHACAGLATSIREPSTIYAETFRKGLASPDTQYWSILGYLSAAGKLAYDDLIRVAEDSTIRLEVRANAVKCLARFSKQRFDRGLPSDPGFWKEAELRLAELRAWKSGGYLDGVEYPKPPQHPSLKKPATEFEKVVAKLNRKLAKARKASDPAEPTNWLVVADDADIGRIQKQWQLPALYVDFLARFSPLRVLIEKPEFYNPFWLFGASELIEAQHGYSFNPIEGTTIDDWPSHLVVIASHGGDPYVLDLSRMVGDDAPVLTAEHGAGEWNFQPVADSFAAFLSQLAR